MKILFTTLQVFDTNNHNKKGLLPKSMPTGGFEKVKY
jgi:hypothetical protein